MHVLLQVLLLSAWSLFQAASQLSSELWKPSPVSVCKFKTVPILHLGLGFTLGPFIGAILYDYGGFQLPFFFLGILLLVATVVSVFLVEGADEEEEDEAQGSMIGMLKIPLIWIMIFAVVICAISLSFFDPTLAGRFMDKIVIRKSHGW